ncbi:MAG: heme lyase CcmF/NrfE family subunit [Agarilytica sp.]
MVPEYGQLCLIMALLLSLCLAVVPLMGTYNGKVVWMASSRSLSTGLFVFILLSFGFLGWSFYVDDFSVKYVANHSNSLLPVQYKLSAVWGGHEGSLLLWVLMLTGWTFAVSVFSKKLPIDMVARVLSVMGMIAVGFLLFMILTSNPFDRILPNVPHEGSDLNPLLQDFGLIVHPPTLYMGYVGFSVVFAFAIAALLSGRVDSAWARWARPWTNLAWAFLSLGIALGSWWAYYELGWGGWWFWDPVENASFMPWLVGTALIHTLAMTEKRGSFKNWTLFLAIFTFSLSLLGTFLVRSGVLTSVHAFATDPERGVFILGFLAVVVGGSLTLFALRAPVVKSASGFKLLSRESFILMNTIILVITVNFVLLGTLYPLLTEAVGAGKISVGVPYFNFFFVKLMLVIAMLMGLAIMLNWKKTDFSKIKKWQIVPFLLSLWVGTFIPGIVDGPYSIAAAVAITLGSWVIFACFSDVHRKTRNASSFGLGLKRLPAGYYGMIFAHIGFGLTFLGASVNTIYSVQRDVRLTVGNEITIANMQYELSDVQRVRGPNYMANVGEITVSKDGQKVVVLSPEKRNYLSGGNVMTEAAIDAGFLRDIYVALGNQLSNTDWEVRIHYKPLVRWIWLGVIFMSIGGIVAVSDKRYRLKRKDTEVEDARNTVPEVVKTVPEDSSESSVPSDNDSAEGQGSSV